MESTQYLTFPYGEYIDIDYKFNGKKRKLTAKYEVFYFILLKKKKKTLLGTNLMANLGLNLVP